MTHAHGGLLVALVAVALGAVAGNLLVAAATWALPEKKLHGLPAAGLCRLATLGLTLPLVSGVVALAAVLMVPTLALVAPGLDHCTMHPGAPHICFIHGTLDWRSPWEAAGVAAFGAALLAAVGREGRRLLRSRRAVRALIDGPVPAPVVFADDDELYAFSVGLVRPRIVLSSGLKRLLSKRQLRAAFAHERAHVRHRDALVRVAARLSSFLLFPPLRAELLHMLVLGQEKRADAAAARSVGSAALVAETLLRMFRAGPRGLAEPLEAPALADHSLAARIEALCAPPPPERLTRLAPAVVVALAASTLAAAGAVHQSAEAAAGLLMSSPVHAHDVEPAGPAFHITHE